MGICHLFHDDQGNPAKVLSRHFLQCLAATFLAFSVNGVSAAQEVPTVSAEDLLPGDVLLAHLNCYLCRAIERETGLPYSHSGVFMAPGPGQEPIVLEALHGTEQVSLGTFRARVPHSSPIMAVRLKRPVEIHQDWQDIFQKNFAGSPFDPDFLWTNRDSSGREAFYCSEFVVKFLNQIMGIDLQPKPMSFRVLPDFWATYFHHQVPIGQPGWSPADFLRGEDFQLVGELLP